jgi:hypothetical protein
VNDKEIEAQVAMLRSAIEILLSMKRHSVPNAPPIAPPTPAKLYARPKWMLAARAFADRYPLAAWQVRRICANHDWALKLAGTWHVDFARFNEFADKVDRGEASFDSSEKFASSLANGPQPDQKECARNSQGERSK